MDSVFRALSIYIFLLLIFRISGKRTIAEMTMFDFVLILTISEAAEQALLWRDFSLTNGLILITSIILIDLIISLLKQRSKRFEKIIDSVPLILLEEGEVIKERLLKSRIDEEDILEAARKLQGLQRLDQIRFAILEKDGKISVIPKE